MAEYGEPGEPETLIPPVTQQALAEMIGTTRSRVSFFMNRFRKLGYIDYKAAFGFTSRCSTRFCTMNCQKRTHPGPNCSIPHPARHERPNERSWRERRVDRSHLPVRKAGRKLPHGEVEKALLFRELSERHAGVR